MAEIIDWEGMDKVMSLYRMLENGGKSLKWSSSYNHYYNRCFYLKDIKTQERTNTLSGRAQSATCVFCKKTITTWPSLANKNTTYRSLPRKAQEALDAHASPCSSRWFLDLLCKWSMRTGSYAEIAAVDTWKREEMTDDPKGNDRHDHYRVRIPASLRRCFIGLPQPPNSEMALMLEIGLVGVSQIQWDDV